MRKLLIAVALAVMPLASACTTLAEGGPVAGATVIDEQAMYAAEVAYNVPAHAYVTADANGLLTPEIKAQVKPLLLDAYKALQLARAAYAAGNASGFAEQVAAVKNLASQASALIPK